MLSPVQLKTQILHSTVFSIFAHLCTILGAKLVAAKKDRGNLEMETQIASSLAIVIRHDMSILIEIMHATRRAQGPACRV